jgi:hypothetical protein
MDHLLEGFAGSPAAENAEKGLAEVAAAGPAVELQVS